MPATDPLPSDAPTRSVDLRLLFTTRVVRLFAYGALSLVLVLYLAELGLPQERIGLLLSVTLLGDTAFSLWLTTSADRVGRRRTLALGAGLMVLGGVVFAGTGNFLLLLVAATAGVLKFFVSPAASRSAAGPSAARSTTVL